MSEYESIVRVAMAKRLSTRWVEKNATPEYVVVAYSGFGHINNLPSLLRAFRDSKVRLGSVPPILDLSVKVVGEKMILKSRNKEALVVLDSWLQSKGCETAGIW